MVKGPYWAGRAGKSCEIQGRPTAWGAGWELRWEPFVGRDALQKRERADPRCEWWGEGGSFWDPILPLRRGEKPYLGMQSSWRQPRSWTRMPGKWAWVPCIWLWRRMSGNTRVQSRVAASSVLRSGPRDPHTPDSSSSFRSLKKIQKAKGHLDKASR